MNKLVISISVIFLLVLVLCLKISLVEYFSNHCNNVDGLLKKLKSQLGITVDMDGVKDMCSKEYKVLCNDNSINKILNSMTGSNPISPKNMPKLAEMPESFNKLNECIMLNGLMEMNFDM
jgi:hypothetical protein